MATISTDSQKTISTNTTKNPELVENSPITQKASKSCLKIITQSDDSTKSETLASPQELVMMNEFKIEKLRSKIETTRQKYVTVREELKMESDEVPDDLEIYEEQQLEADRLKEKLSFQRKSLEELVQQSRQNKRIARRVKQAAPISSLEKPLNGSSKRVDFMIESSEDIKEPSVITKEKNKKRAVDMALKKKFIPQLELDAEENFHNETDEKDSKKCGCVIS